MNHSGHYHWILMVAEEYRERRLRDLEAEHPDFFGDTEKITEPIATVFDASEMVYQFVPTEYEQ